MEEIAAVVPGDGSENVSQHREIILRLQGGGLCCISHLHPAYLVICWPGLASKGLGLTQLSSQALTNGL